MSFRERMQVSVSNAEYLYADELRHRGLIGDSQANINIPFTNADRLWHTPKLAVYLDGAHHLKPHRSSVDDRINDMLTHLNYTYLRFSYKAPPTKKWIKQISDTTEEVLIKNGYLKK